MAKTKRKGARLERALLPHNLVQFHSQVRRQRGVWAGSTTFSRLPVLVLKGISETHMCYLQLPCPAKFSHRTLVGCPRSLHYTTRCLRRGTCLHRRTCRRHNQCRYSGGSTGLMASGIHGALTPDGLVMNSSSSSSSPLQHKDPRRKGIRRRLPTSQAALLPTIARQLKQTLQQLTCRHPHPLRTWQTRPSVNRPRQRRGKW